MPLVPMRPLLDAAAEGGYGLAAFNFNDLEQLQAVLLAADETASPVIVACSSGARKFAGDAFLRHMALAGAETWPDVPFCLHLDHGSDPDVCKSAIDAGFTSVMMDGSLEGDGKTPSSYEYNVAVTREVVEYAHPRGVTVEGEIGTLGGVEDGHGSGEVHLTDPDQAEQFVADTGVDALAVAIGTSHGAYKFTEAPAGDVLVMDLIEEINRRLPDTHLVMHGSSSVPGDLIERINAAGGALEPAFGVPVDAIQRGIRHGVRKVNVDTDGRLAATAAVREYVRDHPDKFDPRGFFVALRDAVQVICRERMEQFGQAGHAGDVDWATLETMAARYREAPVAGSPPA